MQWAISLTPCSKKRSMSMFQQQKWVEKARTYVDPTDILYQEQKYQSDTTISGGCANSVSSGTRKLIDLYFYADRIVNNSYRDVISFGLSIITSRKWTTFREVTRFQFT